MLLFFATAATEPSETVERIAQGLNEELYVLKEAIKVVAKKPPAEILQAIDQDFDQLLAHLENRDQLVSQYEEKLAQFQEAFEKNQSELSSYIDHLKIEEERLNRSERSI